MSIGALVMSIGALALGLGGRVAPGSLEPSKRYLEA